MNPVLAVLAVVIIIIPAPPATDDQGPPSLPPPGGALEQGGSGADAGTGQNTLGVGGVATPPEAILTTSDSASPLRITGGGTENSPTVYDGQGHTVGGIDISADNVTVQNFYVRNAHNAGIHSTGSHITIQNNNIDQVDDGGQGDINGISFFGDNYSIINNRIGPHLVRGRPNGSHTDGIQTWNSSSKRSSSNVLIAGNRIEGPTTTSDETYVHQGVMAEGARSTDGGGGGRGESRNWLIEENYFATAGNQVIKLDDIHDVEIRENLFAGSATKIVESTSLSSEIEYVDNVVSGSYGNIGSNLAVKASPQ
jgi:hypothetical protein